jgi:hypothetical protein
VPFDASEFSPFPFAFPDTKAERQVEAIAQSLVKELTDIFDGRVFQKVIPRSMIEIRESLSKKPLHVREIHHHSIAYFAIGDQFNFIGMAMNPSAFGVTGKMMCAINVLNDADFHASTRIAQA